MGTLGEHFSFCEHMEPITFYPGQVEAATAGVPLVAQQFDQDFIGHSGALLKGFYESGQLWALLIGIALGYVIKSAFSYG